MYSESKGVAFMKIISQRLKQGVLFFLLVLILSGCGGGGTGPAPSSSPVSSPMAGNGSIIDHTCTNITLIPTVAIQAAKTNLHIVYGHTSHGSQLITGMNGLVAFSNGGGLGMSRPTDLFAHNGSGSDGSLHLVDYYGSFGGSAAQDLGNPDRTKWASATDSYLASHPQINVIIWSWCGEVSTATSSDITTYLTLMNNLEVKYTNVKFVYMTGHLDGTGLTGNLHLRNEQIRQYCRDNNKWLYDFADIESWGPDPGSNYPWGVVDLRSQNPDDGCNYGSGSNWATAWQTSHSGGWYSCNSAHSQPLNANLKAYAAWWLWARLAGWTGQTD